MSEQLETQFRKLREAWFNLVIREYAHEQDWESLDQEASRDSDNREMKSQFDVQTERIIRGESLNLTPTCGHDLDQCERDQNED